MMFVSRLVCAFAATLLLACAVADDRICYYPSGLTPDDAAVNFAPCNSNSSAVSMCCDYPNGDRCTPEGICLSGSNAYYRDMCTDQTWGAPECVNLCMDIWNPQLTRCDDGSYCCGANNSTCCDSDLGSILLKTRSGTQAFSITTSSISGVTTSTSVPASTTSTLSSEVATTSSTAAATSSVDASVPTPKASSGSSTNVLAIAVGVGCSLGVVLVSLIIAFFFWRRSVNKKKKAKAVAAAGATSAIDPSNDAKRDLMSPSSTATSPTYTRYGGSAIEDGSVMSRLATTSSPADSPRNHTSYKTSPQFNDDRIHEMEQSPQNRFHELPGEQRSEMAADDRRLGSPFSVEKF